MAMPADYFKLDFAGTPVLESYVLGMGSAEPESAERFLRRLRSMVPSMEEVRFAATAAEARGAAARAARAFTGRSLILVVTRPWRMEILRASHFGPDIETVAAGRESTLCRAIAESEERLAAIVVDSGFDGDPVYRRFLKRARELASAEGALLIWDETAAGSRVFAGSFQAHYKITPDLTCVGFESRIGGAWVGGRAPVIRSVSLMDAAGVAASEEFSRLGLRTIEALTPSALKTLEERTGRLARGFVDVLRSLGWETQPQSMRGQFAPFDALSGALEREGGRLDYGRFRDAMTGRGIRVPDEVQEPWCVSLAHDDEDIHEAISAGAASVRVSWTRRERTVGSPS